MKKNNEEKIQEMLVKIEDGLKNINTNESWLSFLKFNAKFYKYSFNNIALIYSQYPEASFVAGFNKWLEFDRCVKKGEKAIKILAPLLYKKEKDAPADEDKFVIKGFRVVNVFDLSQTEGSEEYLPVLISGLRDNSLELEDTYNNLKNGFSIKITEKNNIAAKGYYDLTDSSIVIRGDLSYQQKTKTILHEYAHHMHHKFFYEEGTDKRHLEELIAESCAYIISEFLGVDTGDYSIPYVNSYCKDISEIKRLGETINKIVLKIINEINNMPSNASNKHKRAI